MLFTDQTGRQINLKETPKRIISLVPSQTELLHHLGLEEEVIGITKFCIHPGHWFKTKTRIGGTKTVDLQKIKEQKPDLIIANKEENVREQIEALEKEIPVWVSDINTLNEAYEMIVSVGRLTGKENKSLQLIAQIQQGFHDLDSFHLDSKSTRFSSGLNACYLIWKDPYMTVGGDTFICDMLQKAGFNNVFQNATRYPSVSIEDLQASHCDLLFLSSEPYPFKQKHIDELQLHLPEAKILLVDGEMFSWYGSRLLHAPAYFKTLHQQLNMIE